MERTLLDRLEQNAAAVHSLSGLAKVRVTAGGRTVSGNQALFVEEPDRFRTEVLGPFGHPLLLAATDGEELTVLAPGEGRFYRGAASYSNIQRFTRIPLELGDLVSLLLYRVPLLPGAASGVTATTEGYLLSRASGDLRQELLFDLRLRLIRAVWHRGESLLLKAEYGGFPDEGPVFPRTLSVRVPPQEVEATLNFSDLDINPDIPAARFLLAPPEGYAVEPLP
jgi:outer membrane lipoprotein-sorting protein